MAQIRARVVADATTELDPVGRIRALARKVRVPAQFAAAQQAYRDLSERHTQLRDEERRLIAEMLQAGGEANASGKMVNRIREVDLELASVAESLRTALETVFESRKPFTMAVTEALKPERAAAARRGLHGILAALDEVAVLDAIEHEISCSGGSGQSLGYRGALQPLIDRLRRIAVS